MPERKETTYSTYRFSGKEYATIENTKPTKNSEFVINGYRYHTEEFDGCLFRIRYDMYKYDTDLPFVAILYTNHPNPEQATKDLLEHSKERVRELVIQHVNDLKAEAEDRILLEMERKAHDNYSG